MTKTFAFFDHAADIGIIGYGDTLESAFEMAAIAVFNIMTPLTHINLTHSLQIQFTESDIELALITWLNLLIGESISRGWILAKFHLKRINSHWYGEAWGEPWQSKIERGIEVKGATLTMLSVKQVGELWEAKCVVDV